MKMKIRLFIITDGNILASVNRSSIDNKHFRVASNYRTMTSVNALKERAIRDSRGYKVGIQVSYKHAYEPIRICFYSNFITLLCRMLSKDNHLITPPTISLASVKLNKICYWVA